MPNLIKLDAELAALDDAALVARTVDRCENTIRNTSPGRYLLALCKRLEDRMDSGQKPPTGERTAWDLMITDYFPASLNRQNRQHWSQSRKHKKLALEHLHAFALRAGGVPRFQGRVTVWIVRRYGKGQRPLDQDNLIGAVKPLVDAMRAPKRSAKGRQGGLGIIEDDSPAMLDLNVTQERNPSGDTCDCYIMVKGVRVA